MLFHASPTSVFVRREEAKKRFPRLLPKVNKKRLRRIEYVLATGKLPPYGWTPPDPKNRSTQNCAALCVVLEALRRENFLMAIDAFHHRSIQPIGQQGAIVDLTGQVVLITGGSRGLGRAFAQSLLAAGARVAITGRSAPELQCQAGSRL